MQKIYQNEQTNRNWRQKPWLDTKSRRTHVVIPTLTSLHARGEGRCKHGVGLQSDFGSIHHLIEFPSVYTAGRASHLLPVPVLFRSGNSPII